MSSWRGFTLAVHLSSLGLWAGSAIMSAAVAAISFPVMKAMDVRVPGLALETGHYRFAAGAVAQRTFLVADFISFACAMAAGLTMLVMVAVHKNLPGRWSTIARGAALGIALASLGAMLFVVTPQINSASRLHMEAARVGDAAAAQVHSSAVDDLHPIASALLLTQIVAVLFTLVAGAWAAAGSGSSAPSLSRANEYPEPELLRRKR